MYSSGRLEYNVPHSIGCMSCGSGVWMDKFEVTLGSVDLSLSIIKAQKFNDSAACAGCSFLVRLAAKRITLRLSFEARR